jgi:hypothetical protein
MRDGKLNLVSKNAAQSQGKFFPESPRFSISDGHAVPEIVREMTRIARAQHLLNLTEAEHDTAAEEARGDASSEDSPGPNAEL